jgi:cytochrome c553
MMRTAFPIFSRDFRTIRNLRHKPDYGILSVLRAGCVVGLRSRSNQWKRRMAGNHFPTVFGVLVILAALAAPGKAVEVPATASPGNTAEAEAILGAKLLVCNTCHGESGLPKQAATPIIWGQQENYLVKQMHDFQRGDRDVEVMEWMATALSQGELGPAAAYFSKKNWPARPTGAAATSPPAAVAVCQACHQQNLAGGLAAPRLAGQSYEYLVEAMRGYAEGGRTNSADMSRIMEAISSAEREAMARYISRL